MVPGTIFYPQAFLKPLTSALKISLATNQVIKRLLVLKKPFLPYFEYILSKAIQNIKKYKHHKLNSNKLNQNRTHPKSTILLKMILSLI